VRLLDHVVLQIRAEAVLRPEDGGERDAVGRAHLVHDVREGVVHGRGIGDHADPQPLEASGREQARRSQSDSHDEGPIIVGET